MFLGVYVDDMLIAFHDEEELREVTLNQVERLSINMLGSVKEFLVPQCTRRSKVIFCPSRACFVSHSAHSILNMSELSRLQRIPTQIIKVLIVRN